MPNMINYYKLLIRLKELCKIVIEIQFLNILLNIYHFHINSMDKDKELISLEPQIIQFGPENKQLIKVTNRTTQPIQNCFFCLFNTNKYQFTPDTFSLQPLEHKLITVVLKLKIVDGPVKQFAYLKSKNINKRLTLINGNAPEHRSYSQQNMRSPLSGGTQQLNTLTSRDYKQTQKAAYQKLISQKQAYIKKLQRKLQQQQYSIQRQTLTHPNQRQYSQKVQSLQLKILLLIKQKEQLSKQKTQVELNFRQYRIMMENDSRRDQLNFRLSENQHEVERQAQQIKYLQEQCEQFLKRLEEKQVRIKQNQMMYLSKIDDIIKESEKKMQQMQQNIKQERKKSQQTHKKVIAQKVQSYQKQLKTLQNNLQKKQKEYKNTSSKLQELSKSEKQLQVQKKKSSKLELQKNNAQQKNKQLKDKFEKLQKSYQQLKQQTIIYRNKLEDQDNSQQKVGHYLQMALQSCKNQNQVLKKSKSDIQNILNEQVKTRKYYQNKLQNLQQHMRETSLKLKQVQQQKTKLIKQKLTEQQESHDKIMALKSQNINLLQKINLSRNHQSQKQKQLQQSLYKIKQQQKELQKLQNKLKISEDALIQSKQSKERLQKRIQKYRKQTRKSIKSISENAKDQLKKIQQQKNKLQKKIQQLQEVSINQTQGNKYAQDPFTYREQRNKSRTDYPSGNQKFQGIMVSHNYRRQVDGQLDQKRRIGIKNQRKQLQDSQVKSNKSQVDFDKIYGQLGQLREFKNYVANEVKKLRNIIGLKDTNDYVFDQKGIGNSIFNIINFFKQLEQKIQSKFVSQQKLQQAQKQIQFLKGRITELQTLCQNLKSRERKPDQCQTLSFNKQADRSAIQYIREQMKNQYKKLNDTLKIFQDKYQILKNKVFTQYRSRIIELLSKKDKDDYTINKIQALLQRFVQGLGNTSHKQAILAKEIKLKNEARKQLSVVRQKYNLIAKQMQNKQNKKTTNCIREPLKLLDIDNDADWIDSVKIQAKMLTYQAENARLLSEKTDYLQKAQQLRNQLLLTQKDLNSKEQQIQKLKLEIIKIGKQTQAQLVKQQQEMGTFKKKFAAMQKMQKQIQDLQIKEKQNSHLRDQLFQKRETLKNLRQRQKLLEQLLDQSKRNESTLRDRQRKQYIDESRMQQSLQSLKQSNRQLRVQNGKMKQQIQSLVEQLNKKNAAIKRMKTQGEEYRIKTVKNDGESLQKLKIQVKQLKQQVKRTKQQLDKAKRRKQKQLNQKQSELDKLKSQFGIQRSSLQSIIRALADTLKGIYCSLDIIARKKGKIIKQDSSLDELIANPAQIRSTKIRQVFENVIQTLKD